MQAFYTGLLLVSTPKFPFGSKAGIMLLLMQATDDRRRSDWWTGTAVPPIDTLSEEWGGAAGVGAALGLGVGLFKDKLK